MAQADIFGGAQQQETDVSRLPTRVVFDVGSLTLSLAEVEQLVPGAVIALPRPLHEAVEITCNGQRIGYGTLNRVGDSIGVRITRLVDRD